MKKLLVLVVAVMLAGCEPAMMMGTDEAFLTSELRLVQEPSFARLENIKLGHQMPFGCKVQPNSLKVKMVWTITPSAGVVMSVSKDTRMVHVTISQVGQYVLTCNEAAIPLAASFDLLTEGLPTPPAPPAEEPPAPPAEEPPALDPPVEPEVEEPPMWEACPAGSSGVGCLGTATRLTFSQAQQHCADLREKGYSDWRLPGLHLMMSLLNYSLAPASINKTLFPRTPLEAFWTATRGLSPLGTMWTLRFKEGYTQTAVPTIPQYVRCVRGGLNLETQSMQRVETQEPTLLDNRTGLKWVGRQSQARFNWTGAQAYCAGLTWAGETGWRLPTGPELHSIVDLGQTLPAADAGFAGIGDVGESWTSTYRDAGQHLIVDFRFGVLRGQQNTYILPVFCVK